MKSKTIKQVIRKKIGEWLLSIDDEAVRGLAEQNTIVTGGCIASMLLGEPVNDFDLYFKDRTTALVIANYYVHKFNATRAAEATAKNESVPINISVDSSTDRIKIVVKSAGIAGQQTDKVAYNYFEQQPDARGTAYVGAIMQDPGEIEEAYEDTQQIAQDTVDDGKPKYRPVFMSTNAITLSHRVQLVLRFYGDADVIHENYDFTHCTNYWTSHNDELVLRPAALECLLSKELRYQGSKYPVCSVFRLRKFISRGWNINAGQILKMCMQVSALDLTDVATLEDQLTGVDCAYFMQVLERIKEKDPVKLDSAYLVEILNRMF